MFTSSIFIVGGSYILYQTDLVTGNNNAVSSSFHSFSNKSMQLLLTLYRLKAKMHFSHSIYIGRAANTSSELQYLREEHMEQRPALTKGKCYTIKLSMPKRQQAFNIKCLRKFTNLLEIQDLRAWRKVTVNVNNQEMFLYLPRIQT